MAARVATVLNMSAKEKPLASAQEGASPKLPRRLAVVYEILRTAGSLRGFYADLFEKYGITSQQYNVVRILRGAGPQGLPTLEIVNRMIDQAPGITRLLDRLEKKQLIRRERPSDNRRKVICYVTQKGLDLLRRMDRPLQDRVQAAASCLNDAEVGELLRILERIRETTSTTIPLK